MTLSEFKVWFDKKFEDYGDVLINTSFVMMTLAEIKEKLASVEDFVCDICKWSQVNEKGFTLHYKEDDGAEDKNPEITCPCCDALFKVSLMKAYHAHPGDSVPRPVAMPETVQENYDTLARQYHNAAINDLITTKESI